MLPVLDWKKHVFWIARSLSFLKRISTIYLESYIKNTFFQEFGVGLVCVWCAVWCDHVVHLVCTISVHGVAMLCYSTEGTNFLYFKVSNKKRETEKVSLIKLSWVPWWYVQYIGESRIPTARALHGYILHDVKYLNFLCLGMFSFWVHLGPVLGL
jgi:hypothetical protein